MNFDRNQNNSEIKFGIMIFFTRLIFIVLKLSEEGKNSRHKPAIKLFVLRRTKIIELKLMRIKNVKLYPYIDLFFFCPQHLFNLRYKIKR